MKQLNSENAYLKTEANFNKIERKEENFLSASGEKKNVLALNETSEYEEINPKIQPLKEQKQVKTISLEWEKFR